MKLIDTVSLVNLQPQIVLALMILEPIVKRYGDELVVTSVNDGKHSSRNSKHYIGLAVDIRTWFAEDKTVLEREIREALTPEFYVQLEPTHLHIQYNGRNP